jgi:hypothetical protein
MKHLHTFFPGKLSDAHRSLLDDEVPDEFFPTLVTALATRTVSVPSDEALCICTLASLSVSEVLAVGPDAQKRMAKVWELLSQKFDGLPAPIIFASGDPMDLAGFRWAHRSLLMPRVTASISSVHLSISRTVSQTHAPNGKITPAGFEVELGGFLLKATPNVPTGALQFWIHLVEDGEYFIFARIQDTEDYMIIMGIDAFRKVEFSQSTRDPRDTAQHPLITVSEAAAERQCAIVLNPLTDGGPALLTEIRPFSENIVPGKALQPLHARTIKQIRVSEASARQNHAFRKIRALAVKVAAHEYSANLSRATDYPQAHRALMVLCQYMHETMMEAFDADAEFEESVRYDMQHGRENAWELIPQYFSYNFTISPLPGNQRPRC